MGKEDLLRSRLREVFEVMEMLFVLIMLAATQMYTFVKTPKCVQLRFEFYYRKT